MKKWETIFRVGPYKCEMTYVHGGGLKAEWDPLPTKGSIPVAHMEEYRSRRDAFLSEIGKELGGAVVVIEA